MCKPSRLKVFMRVYCILLLALRHFPPNSTIFPPAWLRNPIPGNHRLPLHYPGGAGNCRSGDGLMFPILKALWQPCNIMQYLDSTYCIIYIYIYIYTYILNIIYIYIDTYVYKYAYAYIAIHYLYIYIYTCMYIRMYQCISMMAINHNV